MEAHTRAKSYSAINLDERFGLLTDQWQPKVVAELNDYQFKVVRIEGDFIWHDHPETDEAFIVLDGELRIDFRDGSVRLGRARCSSFPKGSSTNRLRNGRSRCC
jgi:mannose-6-phosphate isomerase-like protein (cupin superfamily)